MSHVSNFFVKRHVSDFPARKKGSGFKPVGDQALPEWIPKKKIALKK